jgi:hypothetical protein
MKAYWALKNSTSLDGLPSLEGCFDLPQLPESALSRRAKIPEDELAKDVDGAYNEAKKKEFALKPLPAVTPSRTGGPVITKGESRTVDPNRDAKMLVIGLVIGLVAAAGLDKLAAVFRSSLMM